MIYWLEMLPLPKQTYKGSCDPRLAVTQFDRNFRQRQRYSLQQEVIDVSWRMTQLQYDLFKHFVDKVLVSGSLEFQVTILGLDGLEERTVRLQGGKHTMAYVPHRNVDVSATLIANPASSFDADIYGFLITLEEEAPDAFVELSEVLSLYIEEFFGESGGSPTVSEFLSRYT